MGTRFIATTECRASGSYKAAVVSAREKDIVLSEKITGVPVSVISTPYVESTGLTAGPLAHWMLRGRRTKHLMRTLYALRSIWRLKHSLLEDAKGRDYWQAGRSVAGIHQIESVETVIDRFTAAAIREFGSHPRTDPLDCT